MPHAVCKYCNAVIAGFSLSYRCDVCSQVVANMAEQGEPLVKETIAKRTAEIRLAGTEQRCQMTQSVISDMLRHQHSSISLHANA